MALATQYFVVVFDNEASGPFVALSTTELTWPGGGRGFIVSLVEDVDGADTGKLAVALIAGALPTNNEVLTQGATTADTNGPLSNGDSAPMLYPAFFREDTAKTAPGVMSWTGQNLGVTHSFLFDGQTTDGIIGETLTFSPGGQTCVIVEIISDAGASGEYGVRWTSFIDLLGFPDDNDTFTGDDGTPADGALNMVVHDRCYRGLHLHRLLADLSDDPIHAGDDVLSTYKPTPSSKDTATIINLLGNVVIDDTIAQHMYDASVTQASGGTKYSGYNVNIVDSDGLTVPVLIVDDVIKTEYWGNAFMPDSIAGRIRILQKVRTDGVDIDGRRVKGKLLRFNDFYFEGGTTLGDGATGLSLFSSADGNNATAEGTVAGAPYNTIVPTEGFQTIDYNNGGGLQPYALSYAYGSANALQTYERTKWIQREDSGETLFGRNARLFGGVTLNFAYDAESGNFSEDEIVAWGTEIPYTSVAAAQVEQVNDSGGPSFVDQTTGFNDATDANFTPFPDPEEDELDYCSIGMSQPFNKVVFDNGSGTAVAGTDGAVAWEYWNGTAWTALGGVTDGTTGFTAAKSDGQVLTFTRPTDWATLVIDGGSALYHIRARVTTLYTVNPVYDQGFITGTFVLGDVVVGDASGARGRIVYIDAATDTTGTVVVDTSGAAVTAFNNTELVYGASAGGAITSGTVVNNAAAGKGLLVALDDQGAAGNMYCQQLTGVVPVNDQKVYGSTSNQDVLVNVTVASRVVNTQYVGGFTGTNWNTNFGIGIATANAIANDKLLDLLGVNGEPPNNQVGAITGLDADYYVTCAPWDGSTNDAAGDPLPTFGEMLLGIALTGASTIVDVGTGNIPDNTPQAGFLRIQRDSDDELDRLEYVSHDGDDEFTLGGSTPTAPSAAAIGNTVMRSPIDEVAGGASVSFTAVLGTPEQFTITAKRGGTVSPIKPAKATATFGATGFDVNLQAQSDV